MDIIEIKIINHKCEVIGKKDGKDLKYLFELTDPKLLRYINLFLNKKKKDLKQAVFNMEDDHFFKKLRNFGICYGIASVIGFLILFFTLYASEFVSILGFLGTAVTMLSAEIARRSISYENDPGKEKIVNDLKKQIENIEKTKDLVSQKINSKKEHDLLVEEEKLRKERMYYKKMRSEVSSIKNSEKMKLYFSDEELKIFNRLVYYSQRLGPSFKGDYPLNRDEILAAYFNEKMADPSRSNLDILNEIEKNMFEKRYGHKNKKK